MRSSIVMLDPSVRSSRSSRPLHQLGNVDGFGLQLLPPREGQHALGQRGAAPRAAQRVLDQRLDPRIVAGAPLDQLEAAHHGGQQIVEVVGDAAGQLADRFHLLRLEERLPGQLEFLLRAAALGDVARDLGEAEQAAVGAADRIDHDVRPEPRAVLAHAPAFLLETSLPLGRVEGAGGFAGGAIFLRVETREMLADDLLRPVALDAFRAGIPAHDLAVGIEHVDRVVDHALDEQPQLFLAVVQLGFRLPALAEIARDLGVADQRAGRAADRVDDDMGPEAAAVLAHAPALGLELAGLARRRQRTGGKAGRAILRRIELREMPADDLWRLVSLEALRAGVPARDVAFGVEHVDRVVGDRADKQLEPLPIREAVADLRLECAHGTKLYRVGHRPYRTIFVR